MHEFIDRGIRGGISIIGHPYSRANISNDGENTYIFFCDINNQYGWAMSQYLPQRDFSWDSSFGDLDLEITREKILTLEENDETGYFLEVDLEYPQELHNSHDEFPLCPENISISDDWLSEYQKVLKNRLGLKGKSKKLCLTLFDKSKYVLHYSNLKFCLQNGMILRKVHKVLKFKQSQWLKSYIDLNTKLRQQATSKFEENFAKLMNNSVYGKTCENTRKYTNLELVTNKSQLQKYINSPLCSSYKIYGENFAAIQLKPKCVRLDKPRYVGFTVLELSKLLMYQFHYKFMIPKFGNENLRILLSDTDSFCYEIRTENNIYENMRHDSWFDFSNYPIDHPNFDKSNRHVPGKMKDEMGGKQILEFVGLRSKMYSLISENSSQNKKVAKGFLKSMRTNIDHGLYLRCIDEENLNLSFTANTIRQQNHEMFLLQITKSGLCAYNDKKFVQKVSHRNFICHSFGNKKLE